MVSVLSHAHADIMAPGNAARFDIAHITELLADRAAGSSLS
jgi:hypothetical protein